jgi:hypothetical protein
MVSRKIRNRRSEDHFALGFISDLYSSLRDKTYPACIRIQKALENTVISDLLHSRAALKKDS